LNVAIEPKPLFLRLFRWTFLSLILLSSALEVFAQQIDSTEVSTDTTSNQPYTPTRRPTFRPRDRYGDPFSNTTTASPLFLKDPSQMKLDVEIDTAGNYTIYEKIGELNYRPTSSMSLEEFKQYQDRQILKNYWQTRARAQDGESPVSGRGLIPKIFISPVLDRIFGGSYVELIPRGFVTLDFGAQFQKSNSPGLSIRQQRNGGFEFDQQINMSVVGKVGEKLAVTANFDNNNSFDFQNNMKVEYTGFKEDILQKLEIGNVSLPLNNTLIQGAQNLFGVKAQLQFGKLNVTTIATTQRGKTSSLDIAGGGGAGGTGQGTPFQIIASQYDENRHFFLNHFFRDNYNKWVKGTPMISSGVYITRVEVYILNRANETTTLRNVVGFMDLGESTRKHRAWITNNAGAVAPFNDANILWSRVKDLNRDVDGIGQLLEGINASGTEMVSGTDYEKMNGARKLNDTEFTFHRQLGYITLSRKIQNDEAIAVSYEYTYKGQRYQVGELSEDYGAEAGDKTIFLKLLRQRNLPTVLKTPAWDLMMKNVYSVTGGQFSQEGFQLRVIYRDDATGIDNPHFQEPAFKDHQLVSVFGLDRLNPVNDPQPDGNFDYVEGITVNSSQGLVIFPFLEPFGKGPLGAFFKNDQTLVQKYSYDTLYRTTKADAELFATKNKFWLRGFYTGSGGSSKEILIPGFGVAQGSVKLFAGGIPMVEGTDYVVDYTFGKVTILNDAILNSGKDIEMKFEQNDPFAFQTRSLLGTRFDYRLNEDVNFGSTFLYYNERPLVSRNQIGTEPARNMQYGFDFNINKKSRFLTKMVDALPFLETKEPSSVNLTGEFAQLLPGTSNVIDGESTAYIDDFESSATPYSLMNPLSWKIASIPQSLDKGYEGTGATARAQGYRRAKLAWYSIDNQLQRDQGQNRPDNITDEDMKNNFVRAVLPDEIFPFKQFQQAVFQETIFDLAYYPYERGPYNFNPDLDDNGRLRGNIRRNWGAITNAVRTEVDFDKANIEYIEFWMMDPFMTDQYSRINDGVFNGYNATGGKMVIHLGTLSEDIIPDGKHAFENGLPTNTAELQDPKKVTKNDWGYVTEQQYLTNGFDNTTDGRAAQDVGFDGVPSGLEDDTFIDYLQELEATNPQAVNAIQSDVSADDYRHFLDGTYTEQDAKVLQRYKNYNNMDGNTPNASSSANYTTASYQNPDNEDMNADNTLETTEQYYEYDIDIRKDELQVGKNYIVDKQTATVKANGQTVTWYLFRIPIRNPENTFGDMEGFKAIRYMRTILTDFEQPIVLRLANFRMVGSRWRRFTKKISEDGISEGPTENAAEDITVSVVNLEENSEADSEGNKSAYVIPPGVVRDRDNTSSVSRLLNEQSIQMCVDELQDGEGRAMYKNLVVDLFNYKKLRMFFHANADDNTQDDDLRAFIRLGTDFDQNYYEIEIPLKLSRDFSSAPSERDVWPEENEIDIDFEKLYQLKARRDRLGVPVFARFPQAPNDPQGFEGRHRISIVGRPDLTSVQVIMIGVKNPSTPDGRRHSVCIWANELRATGFDRTAGWAVSSTVNAKLADFATVTGALRHTTFGFGSVSSKIFERSREETTAYDVTANVNVDKLIPGNHGIKIPMFLSYENTTITPQYDPANPDMRTDVMLNSFAEGERSQRDRYLRLIQDRTTQRSMNFTNVRKVKVNPEAASRLWDIENFSFSYAYSEQIRTSFATALSEQKRQGGSIAYQFSPTSQGIEPFKNAKGLSSPWLKFIQEFNFNLMPSSLGVRLDLERSFGKLIYRSALGDGEFSESNPNYLKYFLVNRNYNLRWDLTKSLSLEYNATTNAVVDEPYGDLDSREKRDSVMSNLKKFGRVKNFDQSVTANYKLPFELFPITDWIGADYRYQVNYNWKAGALNLEEELDFRNTISNSREQNYSAKVDMVKLYNKVKFLKDLNTPPRPSNARVNPRARIQQDTTQKSTEVPGLVKGFFKLLMSVKSINGTYTLTEGTILPGFDKSPTHFGMEKWGAPGWKFVLGDQDPEIRKEAAMKGWLAEREDLSMQFAQNRMKNINLRANVEPARDLKIQVDVKKETMTTYAETFRWDSVRFTQGAGYQGFDSFNPYRTGSYRVSVNTIRTAFNRTNDELESEVFQKFQQNLAVVQQRFNDEQSVDYEIAQDVLIPSFIAAYTGKDARTTSLSPFPRMPLPNWRVDYTGLSRVGIFKDVLQSITISHAYQSTYSVSNYSNSLEYSDPRFLEINRDIEDYNRTYFGDQTKETSGSQLPVYIISQVLISEQFMPLVGVNFRTKSRLTANLQYKTKRDVALNISNAQITELSTKDVSVELGFTKNNMKLPFKSQGRTIVLKNDVTFRMNTSIADTRTIQRKIDEPNVITNGSVNFQLRPNVSYTVNQKLTVQLYFERTINEPLISTSARRTQTRFGAQIRFSLAQ
jgi:cell surface protein SprA